MKYLHLEDFNVDMNQVTSFRKNGKLYYHVFFIEDNSPRCPRCSSFSVSKNGHSVKQIAHSVSSIEGIILICHFQRYCCRECCHVFYQEVNISPPYERISTYTLILALDKLKRATATFESVASDLFLSKQNIIDLFDRYIECSTRAFPEIISFDEVHLGNAIIKDKYAFVMLDFKELKIVDVLPSRHKYKLEKYFSRIPLSKRKQVLAVTMDMWETYKILAQTCFPNAIIAIDSFHVIKMINEAVQTIRKKHMMKYDNGQSEILLNSDQYYMLKKFNYYFTTNFYDLNDIVHIHKFRAHWTKTQIRDYLISIDEELRIAYFLSQDYTEFNRIADYRSSEQEFDDFIERFSSSKIGPFLKIATTLSNWRKEIINSFVPIPDVLPLNPADTSSLASRRLSNGPIEGCNSIIKKIILCGNGYTNFYRLRNRIMYSYNQDVAIKSNPYHLPKNSKT